VRTISAYYGGVAVVAVRLVCVEVDLPQELLLMVLELASHIGEWVVAAGAEVIVKCQTPNIFV
jgi:tetrahydromethanopterin S-methyltransferase subunit A